MTFSDVYAALGSAVGLGAFFGALISIFSNWKPRR